MDVVFVLELVILLVQVDGGREYSTYGVILQFAVAFISCVYDIGVVFKFEI